MKSPTASEFPALDCLQGSAGQTRRQVYTDSPPVAPSPLGCRERYPHLPHCPVSPSALLLLLAAHPGLGSLGSCFKCPIDLFQFPIKSPVKMQIHEKGHKQNKAADSWTGQEDIRYNLLQKQLQTEATHLPVRRAVSQWALETVGTALRLSSALPYLLSPNNPINQVPVISTYR